MRSRSLLLVVLAALAATPSPTSAQDAAADPDADADAAAEADADAAAEADADAAAEAAAEAEAALAADAPHCTGTGIEGVVRDAQTNETMIEAPVIVVGRGTRVLTDYDGRFAIDLPPGTYSLRSYYDLYQPTRVDDIVVRPGECTQTELTLESEASQGEEIVIEVRAESGSAASQLRERRESAAVQDSISSEEMRRAPDASAGDAARRVVGVTIRDDYLYVRGLGGRYVATLMNGVQLPNTDPDFPGVQLDILPSGLLESLTIRKTFTPELPGDWAGGLMDIATQSYPTDFQLRIGGNFGINTGNTFRDVLGSSRGDADWLGFDDGTRGLPESARGRDLEELDQSERDAIALQFANRWPLRRRTSTPNFGLSISMGDTLDVGGRLLGYLVLIQYRALQRPVPDFIQAVTLDDPETRTLRLRESLHQEGIESVTQLSALGTTTLEVDDGDSLTLTALFSQNAEDFTGRVTGSSESGGIGIDAQRSSWLQRTLAFGQLLGSHELPGRAMLRWQGNLAYGERGQPDLRDLAYTIGSDGTRTWAAGPNSGSRFFSSLWDLTYGLGADLSIPVDTLTFRAGGLYRATERHLDVRRIAFASRPGSDASGRELPPEILFGPDSINTVTRLREFTRPDDSYDATQQAIAAYASAEWLPVSYLRFLAGARVESFRQIVESSSPFAPDPGSMPTQVEGTRRTDVDVMPAAAIVLEVVPTMFVRASYGGTVARPQVRELAPFLFTDFVRRRLVQGNPDLERTYIHNFDLRWEWFPSESEVLAVSGFAKLFETPIESTIVTQAGDLSFQNVAGAENYGAEIEGRLHLGHIVPELDWISVQANVTIVHSRVQLTPEQQALATSAERPLAGQPPYVINVSLGFAPPDTNLTFNVYYNVFGPRLEDVGLLGLPDVYREPFHQLDASIGWSPDPHVRLRLSATNLLFQRQELRQGAFVVLGLDPGTTISLGLNYEH